MPQASARTNRANTWAYQELCSPRYCMDYSLLFSTVISCAFQFVDFFHMECDNSRISFVVKSWILLIIKSTPIKCIDPDDTSGQLELEGWLYIVFNFFTLVNEEALFYWQFARGGTILLTIWERRHHFIGNFGEEAPFYWLFGTGGAVLLGKFERMLVEFFIYVQNYAGGWLEFHFMAHILPGLGALVI